MKPFSPLPVRLFRFAAIASLCFAILSLPPIRPQNAECSLQIKRIALDWQGTDKLPCLIRDHVIQRLKASSAVQLVTDASQADAVLHATARVWTAGYVSSSPRSKSNQQPSYQGFASAELTGKDGKTLWSYLATPRTVGWKSITDDLSDQLVRALLAAIANKDAGEKPSISGSSTVETTPPARIVLGGAGATFPAPIYQKWFESFEHTHPEIRVRYDAVGSGEGIERFLAGKTDFGATDMPLSDKQAGGAPLETLHIATVLGAVVLIYNIDSGPGGLNLSPEVLAGIFLGKIQRWNAPEIHAINKTARLPDQEIVVVHRFDGSGTTYALTDYLSKVNQEWKSAVGSGAAVNWPVGLGAERNEGVAETVRKTPNSIGYVEFIYALQHELNFAAVRNSAGDYVKADLDSVTAAAKSAPTGGDDFRVSITNASGKHVYPISTFTWLLVRADNRDRAKKAALRDLLRWVLTAGQKQCSSLGYAPLPSNMATRELQSLSSLD
jgi:phosphate ABC transporter phosphate-binding protein